MGKIMRNGVPYCVGGDDAFRYVNDVTDENYGWIQYQLEDGNWVNYKCANRFYLVDGGKNNANFKYTGDSTATPSIVSDDGLTIGAKTSVAGLTQNMTFDSEYIDFTKYNSLVFDHFTTLNGGPTSLTKLQILDKSGNAVYTKIYFVNSSATSSQYKTDTLDDVITVDVSELSGEHSVRVYFDTYGQGLMNTVRIKACYLSTALVPYHNGYIIKNGEYNDEAFPFTINPTVQHYQMKTVKTENGIKFMGADTYAAHKYACFEMMDWSVYSKVKMNVLSCNRNDCFIGITSNADLHEYNLELSNLTQLNINAGSELEMDISAVNSNGRLYIRVIGDGYVEFTDLYLE